MKRVSIILTIIILATTALFLGNQHFSLAKSSAPASDAMQRANQLYQSGQVALAGQSYQQLVDQGYSDSALFYNLGQAYYEQGDLGRAILNYRRAAQLAPRNAGIEAALTLARQQAAETAGFLPAAESDPLANAGRFTGDWFTLNEIALLALAGWILFVLLLTAYTGSQKETRLREALQYALIVSAVLLGLGLVGLGSRLYVENMQTEAVIVAGQVALSSAPGAQDAAQTTLTSGVELNLLETRGDWARVVIPGSDAQGWLPANALEPVSF